MENIKKNRSFKTFSYRGKSLEELIDMPLSKFAELVPSKCRRHLIRGINKYENELLKQVEKYHSENTNSDEKPAPIKTHERTMIIVPGMIGTTIAVHRGNGFFPVEIKPEMIGHKLKDYVPTRSHCTHGRAGVGSHATSKFVPLK